MLTSLCLLLFCSLLISSVSSMKGTDKYHELSDKEILDHLLHKQRYDKRIKPPVVAGLRVNISVVLLSLSSPDESSLHYEVEFLMHQTWTDARLVHDDGERFPYLNAIHHHSDIWKPDIYFIKHGTFKDAISPSNIAMRIHRNGTVLYSMRRHLVLNCEGDLHIFPFDSPMCTFAIESVSFTRDEMDFHWAGHNRVDADSESGSIALSPVLKNHNAYMIFNETLYCNAADEWRGDFSCLKVRLHFTRDKWFYYTTVFVPGMILVTSSFVTFWIEWNAVPARVMLGVTTMLNFFTTSNGFRSNLPVVSNLTAMNMWDAVCMAFIYLSFLEFILVNYLGRWVQDPDIPQKKKKENAILDSLRLVSTTLDLKHPDQAGTLGAGLLHLGGELGDRLKEVKQKIPADIPGQKLMTGKKSGAGQRDDSTVTMMSSFSSGKYEDDLTSLPGEMASIPPDTLGVEEEDAGVYSLRNVKKIDVYSRKLFPIFYFAFVFYFFIRYHAIEGDLSFSE